jgi:hypothetical protein
LRITFNLIIFNNKDIFINKKDMEKKLIIEDIQRMKYMFGYKPGKVISEQETNEFEDFEFGDTDVAEPEVKPDVDTPTKPDVHPQDDPLRPGRRTIPRPAPQASDEFEDEMNDEPEFEFEDEEEFEEISEEDFDDAVSDFDLNDEDEF